MNDETTKPGLFGIKRSNRNFEKENSWGKNQFNNTFPVALANYMAHKNLDPVYIRLGQNDAVKHEKIAVSDLYKKIRTTTRHTSHLKVFSILTTTTRMRRFRGLMLSLAKYAIPA